jgi:hypothetical protein
MPHQPLPTAACPSPRVTRSRPAQRATLLAATLLCAATAHAQDFPARKPGLWEMQLKTDQEAPVTMRHCIDAQTDARMQKMGQGLTQESCSRNTFKREGAGWVGESVCTMGKSTITSRSVVTGSFDSQVTMVLDATYSPPMMGLSKSTTRVTQTHKGACPSGWKPGDMEMPGMPQRLNINQMPGAKR